MQGAPELTSKNKDVPTKFTVVKQDREQLEYVEIKRLVAKVVEVAVLFVVKNHMYSWQVICAGTNMSREGHSNMKITCYTSMT